MPLRVAMNTLRGHCQGCLAKKLLGTKFKTNKAYTRLTV